MKRFPIGFFLLVFLTSASAETYKYEFYASEYRPSFINNFFGLIDPGELLFDITIEAEPPVGVEEGPNHLVVRFEDENRFPGSHLGRITDLTAYNWGPHPYEHDSVTAVFNPTNPPTGPDTEYRGEFVDYRDCSSYPPCINGRDNAVDAGFIHLVNFLMTEHRAPNLDPSPFQHPYDLFSLAMSEVPGQDIIRFDGLFSQSSGALYGDWKYSVVPVPAAVWLFGTALVGLLGFGKRKTRIAA